MTSLSNPTSGGSSPIIMLTGNEEDDDNYENTDLLGDESPTKRRERRFRLRQMRRLVTEGVTIPAEEATGLSITEVEHEVVVPLPVVGTMSVAGRSRRMEDTLTVKTTMCFPELCGWSPVHFFGVYDGHGGAHVAGLCRDSLHILLADELSRVTLAPKEPMVGSSSVAQITTPKLTDAEEEGWWSFVLARCFERMDDMAMNTCICGSTAVTAVLTEGHIIVANVGDSRAVLSRGGSAIPLSTDQKPDRPDERARIVASGGRVLYLDGARVEGILAMTRALGDKYLKSVITSEPEISFTRRHPEDEFLVLASDGIWDVMSNQLVCDVVSECLRDYPLPTSSPQHTTVGQLESTLVPPMYPSRSASAAVLLTRLALGRMSQDNISVIVIDLKRTTNTATSMLK